MDYLADVKETLFSFIIRFIIQLRLAKNKDFERKIRNCILFCFDN